MSPSTTSRNPSVIKLLMNLRIMGTVSQWLTGLGLYTTTLCSQNIWKSSHEKQPHFVVAENMSHPCISRRTYLGEYLNGGRKIARSKDHDHSGLLFLFLKCLSPRYTSSAIEVELSSHAVGESCVLEGAGIHVHNVVAVFTSSAAVGKLVD